MGAVESSTLDNVGTLGSALEKMEQKLTQIEDIHLHHEARICHNDMIIISNKKIHCQSGVSVVVGPVVGLVTQTSVNILVETNAATSLSLNVFLIDSIAQAGQYIKTECVEIDALQPVIVKICDLQANSKYAIYLGGVRAADALGLYCLFGTMPGNALDQRFLFTYDGHADRSVPGERDMWLELESSVSAPLGGTAPASSSHENAIGLSQASKDETLQNAGAHMVFHLGNFMSVDGYLRAAGIQLVRDLSSDDIPAEVWKERLDGVEEGLRKIYRANMTSNESVRNILRRTGNIFLCGSAEGGGTGLYDLFGSVSLALALDEEKSRGVPRAHEDIRENHEMIQWDSIGEGVGDAASRRYEMQTTLTKEQKEICNVVHGMLLRVARRVHTCYLRQLWDDKYESFVEFDAVENDAHYWIARVMKKLQGKRNVKNRMENSYRHLVERGRSSKHQALVTLKADLDKLAREVTELENTLVSLYEESAKRGDNSADVRLRPAALADIGGDTRLILIDSIWSELISPTGFPTCTLSTSIGSHDPPVIDIEQSFWDGLETELNDDYRGAVTAGETDRSAGYTESEEPPELADAMTLAHTTSHQTRAKISNVIVASSTVLLSTGVNGIDIGGSDLFQDQCVAAGLGSRLTANGLISPEDRKRLLKFLTGWKAKRSGRGCLVACALKSNGVGDLAGINGRTCESFSDGWVISYGEGMLTAREQMTEVKSDDDGGVGELRLRYILVGSMSSRPLCPGRTGSLIPYGTGGMGASPYNNALVQLMFDNDGESELSLTRRKHIEAEWRNYGYVAATNTMTSPGVTGFVGVSVAPLDFVRASVEDITAGAISAEMLQPSSIYYGTRKDEISYDVRCISAANNRDNPSVVVGPLIGGLTPTSANIVCEYAGGKGGTGATAVAVIVVDQISGMEYVCRRHVTPGRPFVFSFNGLVENTSYAVLIQNISDFMLPQEGVVVSSSDETDIIPHSLRWRIGTFTTPSTVPVHVLATQMHKLALKSLKIRMALEVEAPYIKANDTKSLITAMAAHTVAATIAQCCKMAAQKQLESLRIDKGSDGAAGASKKGKHTHKPASAVSTKRIAAIGVAGASGAPGHSVKPEIHKDLQLQLDSLESQTSTKLAAVRILVIGPNRPSWRQHVTEGLWYGDDDTFPSTLHVPAAELSSESTLTHDLAYILKGDQMCHGMAGLLQSSWSGVDIVLHCGGNVDINMTLDSVMSALARAEYATSVHKQQEFLTAAEEQMRNAYRLHWGASTSALCSLFSRGSHLCCSSGSVVDLLEATHYSSLSNLANDYSQFCVENILVIMEKLEKEYQQSLWPAPSRNAFSGTSTGNDAYVHFLNAGSVCIFQLCPIAGSDGACHGSGLSLAESQFRRLENILRNGSMSIISTLSSSEGDRTHRTPKQMLLTSVIILSPVQLLDPVDDGTQSGATTYCTLSPARVRYVDGVAQRLLDLLADWALGKFAMLSKDDVGPEGKEVIFVCPSSSKGLCMRIRGYNLDEMTPNRGVDNAEPLNRSELYPASIFLRYQPAVTFKQLCCGPSVGIPLRTGTINTHDRSEDPLTLAAGNPSIVVDASRFPLYSPAGKVFVCSVDTTVADPHCGLLVVGGDVKGRRLAMNEVSSQVTFSTKDKETHSARSNYSARRGSFEGSGEREQDMKLELKFSLDASLLTLDAFQQLASHLSLTEERRVPPKIQEVWRAVCLHVKRLPESMTPGDSDQVEHEAHTTESTSVGLSDEAKILDQAVMEICNRCEKIFSHCFKLNQESLFGGGILSGQGVGGDRSSLGGSSSPGIIAMLLNIVTWILNEMPSSYQDLFPPPSPLLMKWYWHFFCAHLCKDDVSLFSSGKKFSVSASEMVLIALHEDYKLFFSLCSNAFRCTALFVQVAGQIGLSHR